MSIENAKAFYKKIEEDSTFRETFAEMSEDERQQFRLDSGYDFTPEEWQEAVDEIRAAESNEELSEEELEAVAGGACAFMSAAYGGVFPDRFDVNGSSDKW